MAFTQYTENPAVVTQLPKYPSASGYTWEQVRAAFDVDNVAFKAWFNGTHLPEMEVFLASGLNPTGEYVAETTYPIRSIVTYQGSAYVTLQEVTGVTPTDDGVNYVILVEKGDSPTTFSYNNLTEVPTTFTPASHAHGNITNDGKIGSTADLPVFTTTAGAVSTKSIADAKTLLGIPSSFSNVYSSSYVGTGTYGSGNKNSLTFTFIPKALFVFNASNNIGVAVIGVVRGFSFKGSANYIHSIVASVTDNTLYWHNTAAADQQMNTTGETYYYTAIG